MKQDFSQNGRKSKEYHYLSWINSISTRNTKSKNPVFFIVLSVIRAERYKLKYNINYLFLTNLTQILNNIKRDLRIYYYYLILTTWYWKQRPVFILLKWTILSFLLKMDLARLSPIPFVWYLMLKNFPTKGWKIFQNIELFVKLSFLIKIHNAFVYGYRRRWTETYIWK